MKQLEKFRTPARAMRLMFWVFDLACLVAAVQMPDRQQMFDGLLRICTTSGQLTKSFFDPTYGGLAGAFLNVALVGTVCTLLLYLPAAKPNAGTFLAFFLTTGFAFWGITALNIWFVFLGVMLYCLLKKQKLGTQINAMMFATGLAPLITDLLFRYPFEAWHGFTWQGVLAAVAVGMFIGVILPAGLAASAGFHKGFSLYSAAVPIGLTAFFLRALLYKVMGGVLPESGGVGLADSFWWVANGFCFVVFGIAIMLGILLGGSGKGYWNLMKDSGHGVDYSVKYGSGNALLNFGVFGLFIVLYYNLIGANWNAVTLGCVFCMACCAFSGSHPRNVWPIMVGYVLAGVVTKLVFFGGSDFPVGDSYLTVSAQALVVGLCFANGLSPIAGKYGWYWGIGAGVAHYVLVTCVPLLHGGFCLYNGGFTAAFVCFLFVPVLEHFFRTKQQRAEGKTALQNK